MTKSKLTNPVIRPKRSQFDISEVNILIKQLEKYPDNRAEAFRVACSKMSNRTVKSCSQYYYNHIYKSKTTIIGTTGSKEGFTSNVKNNIVKKGCKFKRKEPLNPLTWIMTEMLKLEAKDRNAIIAFLNHIK